MKTLLTAALMSLVAVAQPALAQTATIEGAYNQQTIINQTFVVQGPVMTPPMGPMIRFGTYCRTAVGIAGPGAPMPEGAFCQVRTPYGPVPGHIVAY